MSVPGQEPGQEPEPVGFAVPPLVRFSAYALQALGEAREEIDALNVYPVPDGDTGTNLYLTFERAAQALDSSLAAQGGEAHADLATSVAAYARGLLLGARGNSGVIMAQLVGALFRHIGRDPLPSRPAATFAQGMAAATEAAYAAVGRPVEGTMLTVARAASAAALGAVADPDIRTEGVLRAAAGAAREALSRTPEQLDVLRAAGVVDAGGRGLCLVLDAAEAAFAGHRDPVRHGVRHRRPALPSGDLSPSGPAYEVMYLLDAADDAVPALRRRLDRLGDSLVVVGGDGLWHVHVHVDDVGAAIEAGIEAGRPHRLRVTHFAEQVAAAGATSASREPQGRAVVAVCFADGLADVFRQAGARVVRASGGSGRRPATGDLLEAVRATGAREVVLLPNDRDVVPAAEAAAQLAEREDGLRVTVIATTAQVQGMAALAVHEPGTPLDRDLVEMTAAARHARSGGVTVAARRAMTSGGPCEPGDLLGEVEGDFVVVGRDPLDVATRVLELLLGGGGELVTVVAGEGAAALAGACEEHVRRRHPEVEVLRYDGGQRSHPLLFGVE